ncbi:MAG: MFS transporter [Gemmataceae bacterium]
MTPGLSRDGRLLFATRFVRLFAYGLLSVVLVLYLTAVGLTDRQVGWLLTLTLLGDVAVSLWVTTNADRLGRRRMLIAGAALMLAAAVVFAGTANFWLLLAAATIGVISPSGNEVGPFLPIEQAALAQLVPADRRTRILAWYNLTGSLATALGSLAGGAIAQLLQGREWEGAASYQPLVVAYGVFGVVLALLFAGLSAAAEVGPAAGPPPSRWGLHRSRGVVLRLSALFALDAFGGGFVLQSAVAWWFHVRFGTPPARLGGIFFGANLLAGVSALTAAWVARHVGLLRTMVFTHLPSNLLLILVPLMPTEALAIAVLLVRFSISQMDVPARQSYTLAVVAADERSAASGVTGVARSVGAALSPQLAMALFGLAGWMSVPFFLAGGVKIVYDLLLWQRFRSVRPPEERPA